MWNCCLDFTDFFNFVLLSHDEHIQQTKQGVTVQK